MKMAQFYNHMIEAQQALTDLSEAVEEYDDDPALFMKIMDAISGINAIAPVFTKITQHTMKRHNELQKQCAESENGGSRQVKVNDSRYNA